MQAPQTNLVTLSLSENITCPQPNTPLNMEITDSLVCVRPQHLNFLFQTPDSQLHWVLCLWVFSKDIQVNWGSVAGRISPFSFIIAKFISFKTDSQGKEHMKSFLADVNLWWTAINNYASECPIDPQWLGLCALLFYTP